jgi:hypothetical protein
MRKLSKLVLSAIAAGGVLGAATLVAQAADKPSLKQLVGEGYEIKAVTFIPMDAIKGMGMDPATTVPQILVTLQKKSAMAPASLQPRTGQSWRRCRSRAPSSATCTNRPGPG